MPAFPLNSPVLSVGLPVRNAHETVERCIESVLSQDFADLELIVSDNASDDETIETVRSYARMDRRVRLSVNPVNVGSHENMNRVLAAARGRYFRWISADDWLETGCLSACVRALESQPEAIGATTWFTIHTADGLTRYEEYGGEFPASPDPARRFERMLWFFHAGDAKYDPIYGVYRRDRLLRSHRVRPVERTDWLLSSELALMGPIVHVHERLAHRTRDYAIGSEQRMALRRRLDPLRARQLPTSPQRLSRELYALAAKANLSEEQQRRCRRALRLFWVKEVRSVSHSKVADAKHRLLTR
jgi:glycosyltransferase involved in cell wall biosynthesis